MLDFSPGLLRRYRKSIAQEQLRGQIVRYLDKHELAPFEQQEALADQILQTARANHTLGDSAKQELFTGGEIVQMRKATLGFDGLLDAILKSAAFSTGRFHALVGRSTITAILVAPLSSQVSDSIGFNEGSTQ
jgi:hypothetical protein